MNSLHSYNVFGQLTLHGNTSKLAARPTDSVYIDVQVPSRKSNPLVRLDFRYNKVSAGFLDLKTPALVRNMCSTSTHPYYRTIDTALPTVFEHDESDAATETDGNFAFMLSPFGTDATGARLKLTLSQPDALPFVDVTFTPKQYDHFKNQLSGLPHTTSTTDTPEQIVLPTGATCDYPLAPSQ